MKGLIIKGIGGFYYVRTDSGVIQTRGRGIFKKDGITLMVGDRVDIDILPDGDGVINRIEPRDNCFDRPPIANVDLLMVVFSGAKPRPNFDVIDKFLIMSEHHNVEAVLCMNKCDLVKESYINEIKKRYEGTYRFLSVSAEEMIGIQDIRDVLKGHKTAFAGPSGVGKSTILNILIPEAQMETGAVSDKTSRGRHTTRHVEIFDLDEESMIFDTPGFTSFNITGVEAEELASYYPEINTYLGKCRFDDCVHMKEPECAVRKAVGDGEIPEERYESYKKNYYELIELAKKRKRR